MEQEDLSEEDYIFLEIYCKADLNKESKKIKKYE
jgi:hypothetical protein